MWRLPPDSRRIMWRDRLQIGFRATLCPAIPAAGHDGTAKLCSLLRRLISRWRAFAARHRGLRYAQIIPVGLLLWGLDAVDRFRAGAALAGLRNALAVVVINRQLGGAVAESMNNWLVVHSVAGPLAARFYVALQSTVTAAVGFLLIWRRVPTFSLHRNALIACNLIGLVVFWLYPVAPPRMLPGYHDITAATIPLFSGVLESKAADQFASLPSLRVARSLCVAVACGALLRRFARRLGLIHGGSPRCGGSLAGHGRGAASQQHDPHGHDRERRHLGDYVPWPVSEALIQPEIADADRYQRCGGGDHGERRRDKPF